MHLDALLGCERIAGDLELRVFAGIDESPLLTLHTVEGGLSVYAGAQSEHGLDGLRSLEHVGSLLLDGLELQDLEPLGQLRSIGNPSQAQSFELTGAPSERGLEISNCSGLMSLHGLSALEYVQRIHLNANPDLVSVAGLDNVRFVEELSSVDCPLLDLQGLEQLSVRSLSLFTTALTSLDGLGHAPRLFHLTLISNTALASLEGGAFPARMAEIQIEDSDALLNLEGLEGLRELDALTITSSDLGRSSLTSLAGLEGLEHVSSFLLSGVTSLARLSGLDALLHVEQFQLGNSALRDLTGMPSLRHIGDLFVLTAPALTGLQGLDDVSINNLWLSDVPLPTLAGLEQVQLVDGAPLQIDAAPQLASLQGLPPVTTLGTLVLLDAPELRDVSALAGLTSLESLTVQHTGLTDLDAFGNLRQLGGLYVDSNPQLARMDGLGAVEGLKDLFVLNNDALQIWPSTAVSEQAGYIQVSDNQALTALPGFSSLRSIVALGIENNPSLTELDLSNLEDADSLLIRGNAALDDEPLTPLERRLPSNAQVKIVSNLSGPARLSPCPWLNDGICDEERADCAAGSDPGDCRSWQ